MAGLSFINSNQGSWTFQTWSTGLFVLLV